MIHPTSRLFGFDRGTPIDRVLIERFLKREAHRITGTALEIGDDTYIRKFGTSGVTSVVLNYVPSESASIVGDLSTGKNIPLNKFDCMILTQTLNVVYDFKSALRHAYDALRPGGSLLLTVPGISQISRYDMDRWGDYWRFTNLSLRLAVGESCPGAECVVESYGNVALARAFLDGLATEDIAAETFEFNDPDYQLLIAASVKKPLKRVHSALTSPPMVLLYHRVANVKHDYNLLAVTPKNFDGHLAILRQRYNLISTDELLRRVRTDQIEGGEIAITFDDGYADNFSHALGILTKYSAPATVFVTSDFIEGRYNSWWDDLQYLFFECSSMPKVIHLGQAAFSLETPQARLGLLNSLLEIFRQKSLPEINTVLSLIFEQCGRTRTLREEDRFMTTQELSALVASQLITIGCHSKSHVRTLGDQDPAEIFGSKAALESLLGRQLTSFSYPYGTKADYDSTGKARVIQAGFQAAFSNFPAVIDSRTDLFEIPRFLVRNWAPEVFAEWLSGSNREAIESEILSRRAVPL